MFNKIENNNSNTLTYIGYSGIKINVSLNKLLKTFGKPTEIGSNDNKIQLKWILTEPLEIKNEINYKIISIYDYKSYTPIHKINFWHIGGKNITSNEIRSTLLFLGFTNNEIFIS